MPESFLDSGMLSFRVTPKPDKLDVLLPNQKLTNNWILRICQIFLIWKSCRMTSDEFIKTLEKQSLIRQRGMQKPFTIWNKKSCGQSEQDPTSEAPVSQVYLLHFAFSNIQQAVAFSKR